ncbi:MAG: peptidylprolyl isomerase [Clostridia bacterium]|nr:peptidylprolyl isomerase [Clostridia bacterium]MBR3639628.1 peptidylprolyl isomerase [Clostridia bacterium]
MKALKTVALITALAVLAAVFSGCASKDSSVVMKLGGIDVRYDVLRFAVLTERSAFESKYGADVFSDAENVSDELREELRSGTLGYLRGIYAALSLAADHGIGPDDPAVVETANSTRASDVASAGGESEFLASIREAGMSEYAYTFITKAGAISDEVYYAMINSGEIVSDEAQIREYLESDGCVRVRQVLVTTENRTDEQARAIAEEVRSLALNGADFDDLISRYGEDMNMFGSTQGYYLMRGVMYREFEDASFALGVGEISEVVKTPAGYSVVTRLEKDAEYMKNHFDKLSEDYFTAQFSLACEERAESLEITDSAVFDKTDLLTIN